VGKWFKLHPERRADIFLATKFALRGGIRKDGTPGLLVDSSPERCRQQCENSLKDLNVDSIDLYYVHRVDGETPVEKTMEELVKLKKYAVLLPLCHWEHETNTYNIREGKIKYIGFSMCGSDTLRRACAIEHVDAMQVEYSPFTLDVEGPSSTNILQTCRELGIAVVAYSPTGRGMLSGKIKSPDDLEPNDLRRRVPRFSPENFPKNLAVVDKITELANKKGCTPGQLAIAWLMAQGDDIIPIPGTKRISYLEENMAAVDVTLSKEEEAEIRKLIDGVVGEYFAAGVLADYGDTPKLA